MKKKLSIKNHWAESNLFRSRAVVALLIIGVCFLGLVLRLVYLQVFSRDLFLTLAENNRINVIPLVPPRGLIFDRHGELLAENQPALSLGIIPEQVSDLGGTINDLRQVIPISDEDVSAFHKLRRQERSFESIPIRFRLTEEEVARFALEKHRFPGVEIVAGLMRYYPHGDLYSHVIGYVGRINEQELKEIDTQAYAGTQHIGKVGIENYYEKSLHGQVGYSEVEVNATGRLVRVLDRHPPVPGHTMHLTIDHKLQQAASDALGENRGAIVVIAPKTGEVLAMVSKPGFDPNAFAAGLSTREYQTLQNDPARPLYNRALRGQYPPASTVKPLVVFTALESNVINPNYTIPDPGWYTLSHGGHRYRDYKKGGHGYVNAISSISQSCDTYIYDISNRLGIDRLSTGLKNFGYGEVTGIDITGELGGLVPSSEWKNRVRKQPWYAGETIITGIGQGYNLATPLQLANAAAIVANRGVAAKPHILKEFETASGEKIPSEIVTTTKVVANDPKNWDTIIQGMMDAVHSPSGTAYRISRNMPFKMAGKTGTAQLFSLKDRENIKLNKSNTAAHLLNHTLFIGFAPVESPEVAIGLIIENSPGSADTAKLVVEAYFAQQKALASNEQTLTQVENTKTEAPL
jgi:penicillin-binding protein 2